MTHFLTTKKLEETRKGKRGAREYTLFQNNKFIQKFSAVPEFSVYDLTHSEENKTYSLISLGIMI